MRSGRLDADAGVVVRHAGLGRAALAAEQDFEGRISGPGFDRSSRDAGGKPGEIGDGFVTASAGLLHRPTGIEFDLGAAIAYPLFEKYTHDGVDQSLLLSISWHPRKGDH